MSNNRDISMNSKNIMIVTAVFLGAILLLTACQVFGPSGLQVDAESLGKNLSPSPHRAVLIHCQNERCR